MQDKKQTKPRPEIPCITQQLADKIAAEGAITVAEYMALAASHYYANKTVFGEKGDFTTAPEISQMFGEMLGAWFVDLWLQMGQPDRVQLIELGPGRGTLMADMMRAISAWPEMKAALSIHLVESSPQLRLEQANALKNYRPTWYEHLEQVPEGMSFIVANEFFDALPVHQFKKVGGEWKERRVSYDAEEKVFTSTVAALDFDITPVMPAEFMNADDGSIFEVSPASLAIIETIGDRIVQNGGAALLIDYGHAVPGLGDTLQSVLHHKFSDPLEAPGAKDITAHVDFSTFKTVAEQMVRVHGAIPQGDFLNALGIVQRAEALAANASDAQKKDIQLALHRLTSVREMGRLFKVMALTPRDSEIIPAGFENEISGHEA
jgi:NADH dehydrogenase [ubiquinone] 1 alpha subcomplex assembly factor 7